MIVAMIITIIIIISIIIIINNIGIINNIRLLHLVLEFNVYVLEYYSMHIVINVCM